MSNLIKHIGSKGVACYALTMTALLLIVMALPAAAQDATITDDEVNAVAEQLYCPVCENIPLDTCGTAACRDWREEIRAQLGSGMTEEAVINDFVARYGDRVVGTPTDPTLRALSLVTPWLLGAIAVLVAAWTFLRWRNEAGAAATQVARGTTVDVTDAIRDDDYYRSRVEQDLQARR